MLMDSNTLKNIFKQGNCGFTMLGNQGLATWQMTGSFHPQTQEEMELEVSLANPRGFLF